jgi:hypothetical protein
VDDTATKALVLVCQYLHSILCYAFFGLNVDRPPEVNKLFAKLIARLKASSSGKRHRSNFLNRPPA